MRSNLDLWGRNLYDACGLARSFEAKVRAAPADSFDYRDREVAIPLGEVDDLENERARLARLLSDIDSVHSSLNFQIALANSIRMAESSTDRQEAKFHINLLSRMGDAFAILVLGAHFVRELGRDQQKPSHLSSQGADFDFVIDTARAIATSGALPVIVDLTTLLSVGDIVAVQSDSILLIECKNRVPPKPHTPRGRLWRQKRRRDNAAAYLRDDEVVEDDGTRRIAIDGDTLQPRNDSIIRECILASEQSDTGVAWRRIDDGDYIAAMWNRDSGQDAVMASISDAMKEMQGGRWRYPLIGGVSEFMREGSLWHLNLFSLNIDLEYQVALAEGDLMLWRFADLSPIVGPVPDCNNASIRCQRTSGQAYQLILTINGQDHEIFHRFLAEIAYGFMPVRVIREIPSIRSLDR